MITLAELQTKFFSTLYENKLEPDLFQGDEAFQQERVVIYQASILNSRVSALSRLFHCCKKIVGDDYWQLLITAFIKAYPSREADITASGEYFSQFIAAHDAHNHVPYLADMAKLEWAWHLCFHEVKGEHYLKSYYPLDKLWEFCHAPSNKMFSLGNINIEHTFILYREHDRIIIKQTQGELHEN